MKLIAGENSTQDIICSSDGNSCKFLNELEELRNQVSLLTELVRTDALTGLFNFRFFHETILLEMERARRGSQTLSMILLDIDYFKKFNDSWGHELGNQALVLIAKLIKIAIRKLDCACRFGGEEFVILLPNTDLCQAVQVAERLREMIATTPLAVTGRDFIPVTASFGVDEFSMYMSDTTEGFVQRVDSFLYQAKQGGRNTVCHPELIARTETAAVTLEEKDALFNVLHDDSQN